MTERALFRGRLTRNAGFSGQAASRHAAPRDELRNNAFAFAVATALSPESAIAGSDGVGFSRPRATRRADSQRPPRHVRSSNAFVTTLTLENAIAAPASIGFSKPNAASGMPIRL